LKDTSALKDTIGLPTVVDGFSFQGGEGNWQSWLLRRRTFRQERRELVAMKMEFCRLFPLRA
jgi:hypothetical protein